MLALLMKSEQKVSSFKHHLLPHSSGDQDAQALPFQRVAGGVNEDLAGLCCHLKPTVLCQAPLIVHRIN